jgi:hypothetical protein
MQGIYIIGNYKGFYEQSNGEYTNRFIAISVGEYEDRYGDTHQNVVEISVKPEQVEMLPKGARGQMVRCLVGQAVRSGISKKSGKPYAFLSTYLRKDSQVEILQPKQRPAA